MPASAPVSVLGVCLGSYEAINGSGIVDAGATDPISSDSDSDGILDGNEVSAGTHLWQVQETDPSRR